MRQEATLDEAHRSPDGQWFAFISEETGRYEVYVERLDTKERTRFDRRRRTASVVQRR